MGKDACLKYIQQKTHIECTELHIRGIKKSDIPGDEQLELALHKRDSPNGQQTYGKVLNFNRHQGNTKFQVLVSM